VKPVAETIADETRPASKQQEGCRATLQLFKPPGVDPHAGGETRVAVMLSSMAIKRKLFKATIFWRRIRGLSEWHAGLGLIKPPDYPEGMVWR